MTNILHDEHYYTYSRITYRFVNFVSTSSFVTDEICHISSCVDIVFAVACYAMCNTTLAEIASTCKTK